MNDKKHDDARTQNSITQQLIETAAALIARTRALLQRLSGAKPPPTAG